MAERGHVAQQRAAAVAQPSARRAAATGRAEIRRAPAIRQRTAAAWEHCAASDGPTSRVPTSRPQRATRVRARWAARNRTGGRVFAARGRSALTNVPAPTRPHDETFGLQLRDRVIDGVARDAPVGGQLPCRRQPARRAAGGRPASPITHVV
jgi:hypothetical protein